MKNIFRRFVALMLMGGCFAMLSGHVHAASSEKKDSHGGEGGFEFVTLDPLVLPIVDENGVNQVISMSIVLEVADLAAAENVKRMEPRLKDAFIQDMYGVLNRYAALKGGVIQVGQIKQRLNAISNHVMGENQINDVLLQVVRQRPI